MFRLIRTDTQLAHGIRSCLVYAFLFVYPAAAQAPPLSVGDCPRSEAEAYLDVGNVRARIPNTGGLFYRGEPHVYEVPKGSGSNAIFAATLVIGGQVESRLRVSATRYGEWELWAGPLPESGEAPADCDRYDRVYTVRSEDLSRFVAGKGATDDILEWPWHLGAPVTDGDGDPDNYNLVGGDLPEILGDQMIWAVMNDRGNEHQSTGSDPLGIEVRMSAYAIERYVGLRNMTFYRYQITNRNSSAITDAWVGLFMDVDLGNFDDDLLGSDTTNQVGFFYNADNFDEGGEGYGEAPPAVGATVLSGPVIQDRWSSASGECVRDPGGRRHGLTNFMEIIKGGGGNFGEPQVGREYYNYLRSFWRNGRPLTEGGFGFDVDGPPVLYSFPGDPVTGQYWSQMNIDGNGTARVKSDKRAMFSSGPFCLGPGETDEVTFAIVWSRGSDHLDSVRQLREDTAVLHRAAAGIMTPLEIPQLFFPEPSFELAFGSAYPNPFEEYTTIRYSVPHAMQVRVSVFDLLGREVERLVDSHQDPGIYSVLFEPGDLPTGVYLYRIQMDHFSVTRRMALVR